MTRVKILLDDPKKVLGLTSALSNIDVDFDASYDHYLVDAKSVLGLFSLNLSRPIDLIIHSSDETIVNFVRQELQEIEAEYMGDGEEADY